MNQVLSQDKKQKSLEMLKDLIGITVGCMVAGIGMNAFLIPNQLASGGASGLGIILLYIIGIPVGATVLAFNIPLLIAQIKIMGFAFAIRTMFGAVMFSTMIEVFSFVPDVSGDMLLSAIYGGMMLGTGLGIVFRSRGTTGGTALAAQLLRKFTGLSMGQGIIGFDLIIISLTAYFFSAQTALYALIALFVASRVIDTVQQGFSYEKAALIISDRSQDISREILNQMGRGVTSIDGRGVYTGESREMILVVVYRTELSRLKQIVYDNDDKAFVILSSANEVMGEGFRAVQPDKL